MISKLDLINVIKLKYIKNNLLIHGISNIRYNTNFYEALIYYTNFLLSTSKISERIYCILNNIENIPLCSCGKPLKFVRYATGYNKHCSTKCSSNDEDIKQKKKDFYLDNYGVDHNFKIVEVQLKRESTFIKKYGVKNPSQNKDIKNKRENTFQERFGQSMAQHLNELSKETIKNKYNVTNVSQLDFVQDKIIKTKLKNDTLGSFVGKNSILFFKELEAHLKILDPSINCKFGKTNQTKEEKVVFVGDVSLTCKVRFLDFYISYKGSKICIEFDESHHNLREDKIREIEIIKKIPTIQIYRIKEKDYLLNPKETIQDIIQIIYYKNLEKIDKYKSLTFDINRADFTCYW